MPAAPPSPGPRSGSATLAFLQGGRAQVFMDSTNCGVSDGVTTFWTNTDEYCGDFVFSGSNAGAFYDVLGISFLQLFDPGFVVFSLQANQAPVTINYGSQVGGVTTPVSVLLNAATTPVTISAAGMAPGDGLVTFSLSRAF